jgi:uncharacterized protein
MSLLINLRHLEEESLHAKGTLSLEELDIDPKDELVHMKYPLSYNLEVERMDRGVLVQGKLSLVVECNCARCLKTYNHSVVLENWATHLPLEGEEAVPVINDCVDLTPFIRDDILLAFPQRPLCESECKGLPRPGKDQGHGGEGEQNMSSSAWAELNKLKLK